MPMLASAEGEVSAAKAALNARAMAGLEARAAGVALDDDSPCATPFIKVRKLFSGLKLRFEAEVNPCASLHHNHARLGN